MNQPNPKQPNNQPISDQQTLEEIHDRWLKEKGWPEPCAVCMGDASSLEHDALLEQLSQKGVQE